jgi:hypothetical protein
VSSTCVLIISFIAYGQKSTSLDSRVSMAIERMASSDLATREEALENINRLNNRRSAAFGARRLFESFDHLFQAVSRSSGAYQTSANQPA